MANTYTKLNDGSWGIRVQGATSAGRMVSVTKKSGEAKTETVGRVLWTAADGSASLCTIAAGASSGQTCRDGTSRHRSGGAPRGMVQCSECGDYVRRGSQCWETGCIH